MNQAAALLSMGQHYAMNAMLAGTSAYPDGTCKHASTVLAQTPMETEASAKLVRVSFTWTIPFQGCHRTLTRWRVHPL
eukprot:364475-Chlamydomonas_euryale.AAC.14